jgi:hypothetical protein
MRKDFYLGGNMTQFITTSEAATLFKFSAGHLANLRAQKRGPAYYKRGGKILYDIRDLERWVKEERVLTLDQRDDE